MKMETLELYVKDTSNCRGLELQTWATPGETWTGDRVKVRFGEGDRRTLDVVGWTDLFFGSPCKVHVVKTDWHGRPGYLVYGGNSGVKMLDPEHGDWGMACVWIEEDDADDLPAEVLAVVG